MRFIGVCVLVLFSTAAGASEVLGLYNQCFHGPEQLCRPGVLITNWLDGPPPADHAPLRISRGIGSARDGSILRTNATGVYSLSPDGTERLVFLTPDFTVEAIVPLLDGRFVARVSLGEAQEIRVLRDGVTESRTPIPATTAFFEDRSIDVSADQCHVYYVLRAALGGDATVRRLNICSGGDAEVMQIPRGPLFPLGSLAPNAAVRLLPRGEILVTDYLFAYRFDKDGKLLNSYRGIGPMALDPTGTAFWAARATSPEGVVKIDLNTGATLERYIGKKPTTDLYGIEVVNGWRASLQGVTEVPTLHSAMTLLLGLALTTVVFFRIAR